jgi:hypothetical protein
MMNAECKMKNESAFARLWRDAEAGRPGEVCCALHGLKLKTDKLTDLKLRERGGEERAEA